MRIDTDDLATLLQMQHIDLEVLRARKKLEALPQRKAILDARSKKKAVGQKRDQLDALRAEAERKLSVIGDEDAALADKQRRAQEEIDAARGDYRGVEARTKELNGFAKRRNTLEAELTAVGEELSKIEGVIAQVGQMLSGLDAEEQKATESFVKEGGALKDSIARAEAERAMLSSSLPKELLDAYEKTAARTGGVAVGRLQGESCGVCRMAIEGGRLIDMRRAGNLAPCPHCGRLLILE
ncbi:zinc ribbon domain-containing protein [Arabiibacter massiliensis]|uniref:zinc ribbon domain-containing protein n=1 Tax=Arabiibacter massiliensis TaxID=1870985 RepID=UPI0009BBBFDC|nr:C4-type zinc ribbon domain-containing protein [Arabiibacter massiliensis]